jgi:predicted lipoprotein with Yx(FWY)xxD motif
MERRGRDDRLVTRRRRTRMVVAVGLATAVGVLGFSAAGSIAGAASRSSSTVSLRKAPPGMILVNTTGRSLYLFTNDRNGKSACTASCAKFWPPLIAHGKLTAGTGAKRSLLGTTKRSDGRLQVTYNGHPLYTYALDKQTGQANGEGSGGSWYVLSASGKPIVKAAATTTAPTDTTTTDAGGATTTPGSTTAPGATTMDPDTTTTPGTTTTTTTTPASPPTTTGAYGY